MTTIQRTGEAHPRPRALVLFDPAGAFAAVKARPLWGWAVVVMLTFAVMPPLAFLSRADTTAVVKKELTRSGRLEKMPEDVRAQAIEMGGKAMVVALPVGAIAKRSIWMTLLSLLLLALLKGARPDLKLSPVAGAVGLAMAPLALKDVLEAATFLARDVSAISDATNPLLSNPAAWLGLDAGHTVAGALLRGLDFFELWSITLVGFGVNAVVGARSWLPWLVPFAGHLAVVVAGAASAGFAR